MARPDPRILKVIGSVRLTPNMQRVTLGGDEMAGFPRGQQGGYVKIMPPAPTDGKRIVRTYTIRHQSDADIDVDFALHGSDRESGPATRWAISAQAGDHIKVGGPGAAKPLPEGHGPFLLAGDMTALPAISVNLEALPEDAKGDAFILIRDPDDKQDIAKPNDITVHWIVEADLGADPALLCNEVRSLPAINELAYAWVACEFEAMKLLRQYLRAEQQFGPERLYISSYWKRGLVEDEHKQIKRADTDSAG